MSNVSSWRPTLVKLSDGREVLSDSEDYRAETEALYILELPTKEIRLNFLEAIEKRRGTAARNELEARILKLWQLRLGAA